ncbi:MAG: deoxyribodipyrimidine photo-lyase [Gammaproteobacteria bacterium]
MKTAIVWLRRDLRLSDNPALVAAAERAERVVPVYLWSPQDEGDWAPGAAARWWIHESLTRLRQDLEGRGSRLVIRRGPAEEALPALVEEVSAGGVFWNRLYDPALVERDRRIKTALRESGQEAESFAAGLLFEPWTVSTGSGGPYRVFTPYWRACQKRPEPQPPLKPPDSLAAPGRWPDSLDVPDLELLPKIPWYRSLADAWTPGESGAHGRLGAFIAHALEGYDADRDRPDREGVSRLSPYLHHGELSPRQVWHAVTARRGAAPERDIEAYLRELGWREFAHHVLFHFPQTPTEPMYEKYADFPWREDYDALLEAWQAGRTGVPMVDAGMRQLWETGWMHNRVRMIVASLLVKNIRAPWQAGARWFWDTLVDADLANNTMGWQWSAGCGADAAPYFRIFNPVTQGRKFDPEGRYVRRWVPELADLSNRDIHGAADPPPDGYPAPVVDLKTSREEALAALKSVG